MKHIVVNTGFTYNQQLMVYVDGECKELYSTSMEDLSTAINALQTKYEITQVDFLGNKEFVEKIVGELKTKYSNVELNFTITER